MNPAQTTTACLVTPRGEGGIAVIEITGPEALSVLDRLFRSPRDIRAAQLQSGRLAYGKLWREDELLDEVVLDRMEAAGDPLIAINCHGGAMATHRILNALEAEGVRVLSSREVAVSSGICGELDVISLAAATLISRAPTLLASTVLLDQYYGAMSQALFAIKNSLVSGSDESNADQARRDLSRLLATASFGRGLCEHARLVIAGRPNIGKSTLANALLRFDRMIVHHIPGTTRDVIEEVFSIDGVPFLLVDTAGMRDAGDEIEREGVRRGKAEIGRADVLLLVFDGSELLTGEDRELLNGRMPPRTLAVINKCDLPLAVEVAEIRDRLGQSPLKVAAMRDQGIADLEARILDAAYPMRPGRGDAVVFTASQEQSIREALRALESGVPEEPVLAIERLLAGD